MTQVFLYNAISIDGFIAGLDGDSDWVEDDDLFLGAAKECGCIALGTTTFEQFEGELYPIKGVKHLVLSSSEHVSKYENVYFVTSVAEALTKAEELNIPRVMLVGGSKTNASFAKAGAISEFILDIHPLILGQGIRLLGDFERQLSLELFTTKQFGSLVQNHYRVLK